MKSFSDVTELNGQMISREQLLRFCNRYQWASKYIRNKDVLELACGGGDVNVYHIDTFYEGTAKKFLTKLLAAMKGTKWYDNSDAMTDYFDTAWYNSIKLGEWNKPVEIV